MKNILLFTIALFISLSIFSGNSMKPEKVNLNGDLKFANSTLVHIEIENGTLTTILNKDVENVTITVKKRTGEVVSKQSINAKEFDTVPIQINHYKQGEYSVEISSPEGKLEGDF